ncbi:uncharacterized protein LOC132174147 [Corylus avellana]|uniref:uncharacterized protein LOC132174147 n=1 Tax=Corylus avellana TaxID=13451 RepID=UPI00286B7372|nr:uncharacterized protein LOC132174147 [Corylus avellana]
MEDFHATLADCELVDLSYRGPKFTWNNGREGGAFIQERLDQVVANEGWRSLFPQVDILVESASCSDHLPVFIMLYETKRQGRPYRKFKHEASWALEGTYTEIIKSAWKARRIQTDHWGGQYTSKTRELSRGADAVAEKEKRT